MSNKIKFLAYYLPQYHQIPENDEWWGEGFTEWTNVKKARPLFKGHQQPVIPGELGYYDLMKTEGIQEKQAALAKEYGIDGFIYYSYWFGGGKMLLEKPAENMLANKKVDLPFCFCWANETWSGVWHGLTNKILAEQQYLGEGDYTDYFNYLLPFFKDERYIKVDNMPMFHIYRIEQIPDSDKFLDLFNQLAKANGFNGMYFITTINTNTPKILNNKNIYGVVGIETFRQLRYAQIHRFKEGTVLHRIERKIKYHLGYYNVVGERTKPMIIDYLKGLKKVRIDIPHEKYIPCIIPNWDNSPRSGKKSLILKNSSPSAFHRYFSLVMTQFLEHKDNPPFIVIKSWNEWAEGNFLEPDETYGRKWLQQIAEIKKKFIK